MWIELSYNEFLNFDTGAIICSEERPCPEDSDSACDRKAQFFSGRMDRIRQALIDNGLLVGATKEPEIVPGAISIEAYKLAFLDGLRSEQARCVRICKDAMALAMKYSLGESASDTIDKIRTSILYVSAKTVDPPAGAAQEEK